MTTTLVHFSSATDRWTTPQDFFDQVAAEFGPFDLDVAAEAHNAKCPEYLGPDHPDPARRDGLAVPWRGVCWMNPPYGRQIGHWVEQAYLEARIGHATVVCLLPARTDTRWFHRYIWNTVLQQPYVGVTVRFLKGRLKFGNSANSAPFPSMLVVFHHDRRR